MEDVKIKTRTGALCTSAKSKGFMLIPAVTFISLSIILTSMLIEFIDYRRIHLDESIVVDRSRGEKLVIEMDITFPRVPCYRKSRGSGTSLWADVYLVLSLDVMDISGEHQTDLEHDISKTRLNSDGRDLETTTGRKSMHSRVKVDVS